MYTTNTIINKVLSNGSDIITQDILNVLKSNKIVKKQG